MRKLIFILFLAIATSLFGQTQPKILKGQSYNLPNSGYGLDTLDSYTIINKKSSGFAGFAAIVGSDTVMLYRDASGAWRTRDILYSYFNGNRTVKRAGLPLVNVGTSTLYDFINQYFFPFLPATISISGNILQEVGTSASISISGATTANDETVFSNGKVNQTYPSASTIYSFGAALTYSTSVTFFPKQSDATSLEIRCKAQQDVGNNGSPTTITSSTKYLQSVYPYLYGVDAADLSGGGTAPYTTLTKLVEARGSKSLSLTGTNGYIYFCYPAAYGSLASILDQNGFQQITSFTKYTANITSGGLSEDWTTSYYIYKLNNLTSPAAWTYTFSF